MRVGIDATPTISGLTGVSRYAHMLVDGLREAGITVRPFAVGRGPGRPPEGTRHLRIPLRVVQRAWRLGLPPRAEHLCGDVDVVHSVDLLFPPTRRPLVATVHDAAALEQPELHSARAIEQTKQRLESLHRATVVIANSASTAAAIDRFANGVRDLVVVPLAPQPLPDAAGPSPIPGPYVLCVSEVATRKDHVTLVRAFAQARPDSTRLVIAGPPGSGSEALQTEIARLGCADNVVVTGLVDEGTLSSLYAGASAFCLTSRQE